MDVKLIPGLEHEPFAEVWLRTVDEDAWREASATAHELGKIGLEVWTTTETPDVAPWLESKGYEEVRRYVISELDVSTAPDEAPTLPLVTRAERPDLVPAMYELALQAYPDQPGRAASTIKDYDGWRGWSIDPHPAEACFFALDGEQLIAYGFLEEGDEHWTHGFMAVDRAHRGRGVAGAIKRAQIAWAREHGIERLRTATETRLTSMRSLNDRLGYRPLYEEIVLRGPAATNASAVLAKAKHENFPVALRILPRKLRRRLETIYGYARLVDDAGDEYAGDRNAALDELEADLHRAFAGDARDPLMQRITPFVRETGATEGPFMRLIEANRLDQRTTHYESWDELAHYCTLSANPVGELVLLAIGQATPERIRWSDDVCTALQLAEHMQDVDEDRARGREYLPAGDLMTRGRELLASGIPLVASLRGWGKLAVAAYVGGGLAAFAALERGSRIASGRERLAQTWKVLRAAR